MKAAPLFLLLALVGCGEKTPSKVDRQKAIYFAIPEMPRDGGKEITRIMEARNLATPGQAMIFLLDQNIAGIPRVRSQVRQVAAKVGAELPPPDPLDEAEAQIKEARLVRSMVQARETIARIEGEPVQ